VGCSNQAINLASRLPHYPSYEWVEPRVLDIPTCFMGSFTLDGFLSKVSTLKSNSTSDVVVADSCNHTDWVYHVRKMVLRTFSLHTHAFLTIYT